MKVRKALTEVLTLVLHRQWSEFRENAKSKALCALSSELITDLR